MDKETDCKGDATSSGPAFSRADKMRFSTLTYEIIEELKMRRELAVENEKKIEKLINERYNMGWKLDQESGKVANLGERHEVELRETRRQLEEKMRDYQVEASQQQVYRKMAEKEKDALKDEIRRLQLANYSLEKKVRESERQEKIQANEREQHICQVSRFESQLGQLDILMKQLTSKQDQLDADLKHVQNLNKNLQYQNSHQKCILDMKETDILKVTQELLDIKVKVKVEPDQELDRKKELENEVKRLKELVNKLEENFSSLDKDKDSWKEKYWDSLRKLDDSHRLINIHLHNAAKYRDECATIEEVQKATQDKLNKTEAALKQSTDEVANIQERYKTEVEGFEAKVTKLKEEIAGLTRDVNNVTEQKETVEKSLKEANDGIAELDKQLTHAKEILNVEKLQVESQTELHMLNMLDSEVQVEPAVENKEVQIGVQVDTGVTQTIDPALCSTEVQTDLVERNVKEVQTECRQEDTKNVQNAVTQTNEGMMEYGTPDDIGVREQRTGVEKEHNDTALKELCQEYNNAEDDAMERNKAIQETRSIEIMGMNIGKDDCAVDRDKFDNDTNMDLSNSKSEHNIIPKAVSQSKETEYKKTQLKIDSEIESLESPQIGSSRLDRSDKNGTSRTRQDETAHNEEDRKQKISITGNFRHYEREESVQKGDFGQTGLSIPKIDIAKSVLNTDVVAVDPDEFSIKLTQDETATIDPKYNEKENSIERNRSSSNMNDYTTKEIHFSNGIEAASMDQSIDLNWEVSEMPPKLTKSKAKKHKLTKEVVSDQFSNFDISKEKFKQYLNRDEGQSKLPKLTEIPKGIPKKQRNYSSMFKIEEEIETVDESDTEVASPKANVKAQEGHSSCASTSVKHISQYQISTLCNYKNMPGISQSFTQKDQELHEGDMNQLSDVQSNVYVNDQRERGTLPLQLKVNYSEYVMQEVYSPAVSNKMAYQQGIDNMVSTPEICPSKQVTATAGVLEMECETDSPNTLTQSDTSSQELKEVDDQSQEYPYGNNDQRSPGYTASSTAFRSKPIEEIHSFCGSISNVGCPASDLAIDESATIVSTSVTSVSASGAHKLFRPSLNAKDKISYPTEGTIDLNTSGLQASAPSVARQSIVTGTQASSKSKSSSPGTEGSIDFLQKYRDIVAKIKPATNLSCIQNKVSQKKSGQVASSNSITVQDFEPKVSPRGRTPRSILKGPSKNSRKPRNVTWNEYVLNKDFVKDGNTPDQNI